MRTRTQSEVHPTRWLAGWPCLAFLAFLVGATTAVGLHAAERAAFVHAAQPLDPYYPHRGYARLTTPQWVGEPGVECVVTLGIDDMRDPAVYERFLRPILERLKALDGRAPVSILTCNVKPDDPQVARWLQEGLNLECHTVDHPCPCLQGGDFAKARSTYERCVDLMHSIPGNRPVAFRMPCCDSLNTPSPRFWNEVFGRTTGGGRFLQIDTSVFNIITAQDRDLPESIVRDAAGGERFRRYVPFASFVNTIEDYPYPYIIGDKCWEFPCVVPSDWSAQHVQKANNPDTVRDLKLALDAAVIKQGTFNLVFHPHGWIRNDQIVELIDHAVKQHGRKVKFLNFAECLERLNRHLLDGHPIRDPQGDDHGVRLIDVDRDGYQDVVIANASRQAIRRWNSATNKWETQDFAAWAATAAPAERTATPRLQVDIDQDGTPELMTLAADGDAASTEVWRRSAEGAWQRLPFHLPDGVALFDKLGRDAGLRLVDVDGDGRRDVLFSDAARYSLYLFADWTSGWSKRAVDGRRGDDSSQGKPVIPPLVRGDGTNNGAFFHSKHLWIQNEDTQRLPNHVDRLSYAAMLQSHTARETRRTASPTPVGAAKIDITPEYPVRLSGYSSRKRESEGVAQKIWAKALAIGGDDGAGPAVLITYDNCGLTAEIREAVAKSLAERAKIRSERLVIAVSHTHNAPCLTNWAPFLFGERIPDEHQAHIDQYTRELTEKLVQVALDALKGRRPARLEWGQGRVGFAANRRVLKDGQWTGFGVQADGPVDHSLPVLAARDEHGKLIAVAANYACHCTTLGDFNQIHGDWCGAAMEFIEQDHPGAVSLITIGCGADANPNPRKTGDLEIVRGHGRAFADEVKRLLTTELEPLAGNVECRLRYIDLPFAPLPSRAQWEEAAKQPGAPGYHARQFLERLDKGETLPKTRSYPVGTWTFGKELAMVFLGGEVVVDYAMRLKSEHDGARLWITAYANDVPCYIASKRVLREGGYEADFSMYFYARPVRWSNDVEDLIVDTVQKLLPPAFYSASKQADVPPPKSPEEALATMQVAQGFKVELVAAEPLVEDPVAFDWGPDGRLWVVEMRDYPNGVAWNGAGDPLNVPGGRVKVLTDENGDGRYDKATLFLDDIPFPNGIKVWRKGVLISAAPSIFYAEDGDGDGKADKHEVLFEGFVEGNQQHRTNGLRWGVDGWLYQANGDSGGKIKSLRTGQVLDISGRDVRLRPDTGEMQTQSGQTQFGRNGDDWGNWFGGNNANPMWHYVIEDHYLRRNPHVATPDLRRHVSVQPGASPVFPTSRTLGRFNDFHMSNRFTSACSPEVYRDERLPGGESATQVFICEPVHNLVHREWMTAEGASFTSRRPDEEKQREFLASSDNWFRPVMARTGPDGALWIADMYRAVIEHPEWIPQVWQRKLDLRAGTDRGRIYRVVPANAQASQLPKIDQLDVPALVAALDSPNGWQRDMVQQMLLWKADSAAVEPLRKLAQSAQRPVVRMQALCTLEGLQSLPLAAVVAALDDPHPGVRKQALRLSEPWLRGAPTTAERLAAAPDLAAAVTRRLDDADAAVRLQLALSLGEWDERGGTLLAKLVAASPDDVYLRTAVLSSVHAKNVRGVLAGVLAAPRGAAQERVVEQLLAVAAALGVQDVVRETLSSLLTSLPLDGDGRLTAAQVDALAGVLETLERRRGAIESLLDDASRRRLATASEAARRALAEETTSPESIAAQAAAVRLLASRTAGRDEDAMLLAGLISPRKPQPLQSAAVAALVRRQPAQLAELLVAGWKSHSPTLRAQVLDALLAREELTAGLLTAIERGEAPASQIDARRRQQLLGHKNEALRKRAETLLAGASEPARAKVIEAYSAALQSPGDAQRGKQVFAKRCAACHRFEGVGHLVGPDIASIGNKSSDALLVALLDPNRAIEDKYLDYLVVLEDGRTATGLLSSESTTSVTLMGQEGKSTSVLRSEIEELRSTGKSLMPEGLEKDLTPQEVADVIAYVQSSGPPPKSFPGNKPEVVRGDDGGAIRLLATTARVYGPTLVFEEHYRNLGYWSSPTDHAAWSIDSPKAGRYTVSLDYASADGAAGDRFVIEAAGRTLGGQVAGTGTWDQYRSQTVGVLELPAGPVELVMRADGPIKSALIDLRGIRLIPAKP
ncbi:MAG: neutral/alkaline non-lysosomal ceramidase N-terminal domain-containing protein [Pirellulales bacterium]